MSQVITLVTYDENNNNMNEIVNSAKTTKRKIVLPSKKRAFGIDLINF